MKMSRRSKEMMLNPGLEENKNDEDENSITRGRDGMLEREFLKNSRIKRVRIIPAEIEVPATKIRKNLLRTRSVIRTEYW